MSKSVGFLNVKRYYTVQQKLIKLPLIMLQ